MVEVHVYDDPLNPQGWGFQPALRRVRSALQDADWRLHPTELVSEWDRYDGPEFPGGRSTDAAVCSRVSEASGMPIDEFLWFEDPPSTSRLACEAIAAVDEGAARWRLMRACQEATFLRRTNVDTTDAVVAVAADVDGIDADALATSLANRPARDGGEAPGTPDVLDVPGVTAVGDRPELPTVVVRDGDDARGVSGRVDSGAIQRTIERVTDDRQADSDTPVEPAIERFSPEGWVATTELATLSGEAYDDAATTARDLPDVVEREFASEAFFRAAAFVADEPSADRDDP